MIRFSVGYQLCGSDEESFPEIVAEYREHVAEVYLPWPALASARSPIGGREGKIEAGAQEQFEADLQALRQMGIELNLLFNANCYGAQAMSKTLERQVVGVLERMEQVAGGAQAVTTASPAVAHMIKRRFPRVRTQASVNMRVGTVEGMDYLARLFDAYCIRREHNRDLAHLHALKEWAAANAKRLTILVNSGCLWDCSGQVFHDNLVAHETGVAAEENIEGFLPYACWAYLAERKNWAAALRATWVRPEDLHHYEGLFEVVKLATRMHSRPHVVLRAYAERRYGGSLLDLLEPGFGPAFLPYYLDNARFPADWFERTASCGRRCGQCSYCAEALERVLVKLEG